MYSFVRPPVRSTGESLTCFGTLIRNCGSTESASVGVEEQKETEREPVPNENKAVEEL